MLQIDSMSRTPVYQQIIEQIERMILMGLYREGDQLPSVRSLSIELTINPNTIQKAYNELDLKGILSSVPGKGCFVKEGALTILGASKRKKLEELEKLVEELSLAGITEKELHESITNVYQSNKGGTTL